MSSAAAASSAGQKRTQGRQPKGSAAGGKAIPEKEILAPAAAAAAAADAVTAKRQCTLQGWLRSKSAPELRATPAPEASTAAPLPTPARSRSDSHLPSDLVDATSLRLKGTTRMEVRARQHQQLPPEASAEPPAKIAKTGDAEQEEASSKAAILVEDSDEEPAAKSDGAKPSSASQAPTPRSQVLRISAGRAAAAAGIHCYADVGELFLELLYQDLPHLLLDDAELAGVEVVSPAAERARLLAKSGEAAAIEAALKESAAAPGIEGAQSARASVSAAVTAAERSQKLSAQEAEELRQTLELEINLEFGARHEDTALEAYEARLGAKVYGQQHRVSVALPHDGPSIALSQAFPAPHADARPRDDVKVDTCNSDGGTAGSTAGAGSGVSGKGDKAQSRPYFRLTGFVDGLVDVPRASVAPANPGSTPQRWAGGSLQTAASQPSAALSAAPSTGETLVVEVKHRMGRIKDPPEIYDVVQLCSYCRALGCTRGDLVQCLRSKGSAQGAVQENVLHVTRIDFSEGSHDRQGWDQHVLPNLYATAAAVYAAREDLMTRLRLLAASPEERSALVGELCPHLGR
eukprot:TRINITY_DN5206_c0_g1_i1.p1 TRINITY_DN5206_c0_g1~~TRINITY_DN5206_c0_g1_i1.p1  ORF type:complete len:588 (+),score=150.81 TRINITY_DN5206_c0_g1_i1:37-1764(+)